MEVIECENCGGVVVFDADRAAARCIFCGGVSQTTAELSTAVQPSQAVEFTVSLDHAHALLRTWTRRSFWAPRSLPGHIEALERVWVPAWLVRAKVRATWTGLVPAPTKSGKRPEAGVDVANREVWVPGSLGLTQAELSALAPFEGELTQWDPARTDAPYEMGGLSAQSAIAAARPLFQSLVNQTLERKKGLGDSRVSVLLEEVEPTPLMLPIWVGCVRYRDRPWRFVINGHSGRTTGRAPVDRFKVALAMVAVLTVVLWLCVR